MARQHQTEDDNERAETLTEMILSDETEDWLAIED